MAISTAATADALVRGLRTILTVSFVPLSDSVARLDTTSRPWTLHLDSDSPVQDQCWAMIDVLRVLTLGVRAAEWATPTPRLRLVQKSDVGAVSQ
jgi:hypothetical protein